MAKLLAYRGLVVSIVLTPLNVLHFNSKISHALTTLNLKIHIVELPFPCEQVCLPQKREFPNSDEIFANVIIPFDNLLPDALENYLMKLDSLPNFIIHDQCLRSIGTISLKFNIPRFVFQIFSFFNHFCFHKIGKHNVLGKVVSDTEPFIIPDSPHRIQLTKAQHPIPSENMEFLLECLRVADSSKGIILSGCEDLEHTFYVEEYKKEIKKLFWSIGPLCLADKAIFKDFKMGSSENKKDVSFNDRTECLLKWLDKKKSSSVIYACFGTSSHMSTTQLKELALGLEASKFSFIWVIKKKDCTKELEEWFINENFEARVENRGLVIREWVSQDLILTHKAIGGFITQCGWSSTLEGVSNGLPMITWPMVSDQFFTEKLITQVWKIGVSVGCVALEGKGQILIKKDDVKKAIESLMDEGDEGEERRTRARKLQEMAIRAIEEGGGSSYNNLTLLVQHIMDGEKVG